MAGAGERGRPVISRTLVLGAVVFVSLLSGHSRGVAQSDGEEESIRPWGRVAFNLLAGRPVGEFANSVDLGLGWDLAGSVFWGGSDRIALRATLGGVIYGWERENPGSGIRRTTTNEISHFRLGPEYSWALGNFRPFMHASVGLVSFVTTEKERESWWREGTETQIIGDYAGSLGVGAGLDVEVRGGHSPIFLTIGGEYHRNGSTRYLTEGAGVRNPDGTLTLHPTISQANLVTFRIGAAFLFFG